MIDRRAFLSSAALAIMIAPLATKAEQAAKSYRIGYLASDSPSSSSHYLDEDPTFRMLASRERRDTSVALTSTLHWFETEVLTEERNYERLGRLNTALIEHAATRSPTRRVILDIDSSESPVHGAQEQSAYNGHFESVCYHPLFVGQSLGAMRVLLPGQAAIDRLTKQVGQRELAVASRPGIAEMSLDQRTQVEALIQRTGQQQSSIGGHRGASELDAKFEG